MNIVIKFFLLFLYPLVAFSQTENEKINNSITDERLNPELVTLINKFLDSAKIRGFKPIIYESYRSKERALYLAKINKKTGSPAAPISLHTFGMAVDIRLLNSKGTAISFDPTDYKKDPVNNFSYKNG